MRSWVETWPGRIALIGLILTGVMLAVIGLSALLLPKTAGQATPMSRDVSASVLPLGQPLTVSLALDAQQISDCPDTTSRPLDIVLVIDRSGSMEGDPLTYAVDGSKDFVEAIDLTRHQLGIVAFTNTTRVHAELSSDPAVLRAALNELEAEGGTAPDLGLQAALNVALGTGTRPQALPVVILFSDGGTDRASAAEEAAQQLQAQRVKLMIAGFEGDDFNQALLERLVTGPGDLLIAPTAADIMAIYQDLASTMNQVAATGVRLEEAWAEDSFEWLQAHTHPPAQVEADRLVWSWSLLEDQDAVVTYRLDARRIGWHVAAREGDMNWVDCVGTYQHIATTAGPTVLVVPPWPWLIPLFLWWVPFLALAFWRRRPRREPEESPVPVERPSGPITKPPSVPAFPAHLSEVESLPAPDRVSSSTCRPSLVVGLGASGRQVLERVACRLTEMAQSRSRPQDVALLQVDVSLGESHKDAIDKVEWLTEEERLVLAADLQDLDHRITYNPEQYPHLSWWQGNSPYSPSRATARMALVADLFNGLDLSRLWPRLMQALRVSGSENKVVWIVASAAEVVGSGLLFDLAHLVRQAGRYGGTQSGTVSQVSLILFMPQARAPEDVDSEMDRQARAFATLQELVRLSVNEWPVRFAYNPDLSASDPVLDSWADQQRVIDDFYLVEGRIAQGERPEPAFGQVAEALVALLAPQVGRSFEQQAGQLRSAPGLGQIRPEHVLVNALGAFTYRLPMAALRRALEARLVDDLLQILRTDCLDTSSRPDRQAAERWLSGGGACALQHPFWSALATREREGGASPTTQHARAWFEIRLLEKTAALLNGEDPTAPERGQLPFAIDFADQVVALLKQRRGGHSQDAQLCVRESVQVARRIQQQLRDWEKTLRSRVSGSLYRCSKESLKSARDRLTQEQADQAQATPLDADLEMPFYQDYIEGHLTGEDLRQRAARHLGWAWRRNEDRENQDWQLCLAVAGIERHATFYTASDAASLIEALDRLAHLYALIVQERLQFDKVVGQNSDSVGAQLTQQASPLLDFSKAKTGQVSLEKRQFLAVPDQQTAQVIAAHVPSGAVEMAQDPWACTLITLLGPLSLTSLKAYSRAQEGYSPSDPTLHVLLPENLVARLRPAGHKDTVVGPALRAVLQDEALVSLFGQAVHAGLISATKDGAIVWRQDEKEQEIVLSQQGNWYQAFKRFALELPRQQASPLYGRRRQATIRALKQALTQPPSKKCSRALDRLIEQLEDPQITHDPLEQQVGWLLDWLTRR
jgi:uncharacterized protein YegL